MRANEHIIELHNDSARILIDLLGGAIVDFSLKPQLINPFTFCFEQEVFDGDNFYFKGHFLCLPRWGDPTAQEQKAGLCKHGDFARIPWSATKTSTGIEMSAESKLESIQVQRTIELDRSGSVYLVTERVSNRLPFSRIYQMVQHPTIAAPFLNEYTIVDCNALQGFDYAAERAADHPFTQWPTIINKDGKRIDVSSTSKSETSVYSFIVNPEEEGGWITAYSPTFNLLVGFLWPRRSYPWINMWVHKDADGIKYRGLEFGTTCEHKPFIDSLKEGSTYLFGQPTYGFLDAFSTEEKRYMTFLLEVDVDFTGVETVTHTNQEIVITARQSRKIYSITHSFSSHGI